MPSAPAPPYQGPVEALTLEEAAVRLRASTDFVAGNYPGPWVYLGRGRSMRRIPAWGLHDWISSLVVASDTPEVDDGGWGNIGNGERVPAREQGEAA